MSNDLAPTATATRVANAVVVFVKSPVLGRVKTRLASAIGDDAALHVYRALTEHVVNSARTVAKSFDVLLFADSVEGKMTVASWLGGEARVQRGDDLGSRIVEAFEESFVHYSNVVVIGSDAPYVSPLLAYAFDAIAHHDCVLGPAYDGGFYLVGLSRTTRNWRDLFKDITWSTSSVFIETVRNAREAEIDVYVMPAMHDVDTVADMRAVLKTYPDGELSNAMLAALE